MKASEHRAGDLVRCTWQPRSRGIDKRGCAAPMKHKIKGRVGVLLRIHDSGHFWEVMFSQIIHPLSPGSFEVISESR